MGLNAYFAYQVVGAAGSGSVSYGLALAAVFTEGWIFMFLALTGMRHWLVKIIPATIKTASGVGIGMFIALIGLSYSAGIGLIAGGIATPTELAGCDPGDRTYTGQCAQGIMASPKASNLAPLGYLLML
jgi:AGZA family xanthine/uracil permease-like MFS transporter